jgi:hypothetical protein
MLAVLMLNHVLTRVDSAHSGADLGGQAGRLLVSTIVILAGCTQAGAQSTPISATSSTHAVRGELVPVALDRVGRVSVDKGKLVLHGSLLTVAVDPPASADVSQPTRVWALTTEAHVDGKRVVTFTHSESVEDFSIELPGSDAELLYGVFPSKTGGEVMVLAWGSETRCYWGYLTIARR